MRIWSNTETDDGGRSTGIRVHVVLDNGSAFIVPMTKAQSTQLIADLARSLHMIELEEAVIRAEKEAERE